MAKFAYAAVTLGWALVMALFSSQTYAQQDLRPWLERVLSRTGFERYAAGVSFRYGDLTVSIRELGLGGFAEFLLRKLAHLAEYAVLGALLLLLLYAVFRGGRWLTPAAIAAVFLFAVTDEIRQSYVEGRTPLPEDVLLDTVGACFGSLFALLILLKLRPRRGIPPPSPPMRAGGGRPKERHG